MDFQEAIERDADDLHMLAKAAQSANFEMPTAFGVLAKKADFPRLERGLDEAAWRLRRCWLELAHKPADRTLKSPCVGDVSHIAGGGIVDFGYERDLDVSLLEERSARYMQQPAGWSAALVLFRSAQAALSGLLHYVISNFGGSVPVSARWPLFRDCRLTRIMAEQRVSACT